MKERERNQGREWDEEVQFDVRKREREQDEEEE
jgi:hypothetical protein